MKIKTSQNSVYRIPCRHFVGYQPPCALKAIEADIKALESEIMAMLSEVV